MWPLFSDTGLNPLLKDLIDVVDKVVSALAILAAGLFAYFKFFKERVHRPRLEPTVSARLIRTSERQFLKVTAAVRNTGLTKVDIALEPSCLRIFGATGLPSQMADEPDWESVAILDLADRHEWVEPQELLRQTWLVAVPTRVSFPAYRIELRVVGRFSEWYAEVIVMSHFGPTPVTGSSKVAPYDTSKKSADEDVGAATPASIQAEEAQSNRGPTRQGGEGQARQTS